MHPHTIYEEKVFSKWIAFILGAVTSVFLVFFVVQLVAGPLGSRPAPNWVYLLFFVFFLGISVTFSRLTIRMTAESISIAYGPLRRTIPWHDVADCYEDNSPAYAYGGWGIRIARVGGHWRLVFNVIGGPRVVLSLKRGRLRQLVFSTAHPEEVTRLVKQHIEGRG